jgi:DNA polymerase-3 subunit epsilon
MIAGLFGRKKGNGKRAGGMNEKTSLGSLKDSYELAGMLLDDTKFVVFDTELTGLKVKQDSIVSIGAVKMVGGRIFVGDYFYRLVEPKTKLTAHSIAIHEITPSEAATWPDIDKLLPEFLDFCKDSVLVGHFVSLDMAFLNKEMKRLYDAEMEFPVVDTQKIVTWLAKKEDFCSFGGASTGPLDLSSLARRYDIPVGKAHNALDDAFVTAQLFQRLLAELSGQGIRTVAELIRIGRP